jgi:hypothetical protein
MEKHATTRDSRNAEALLLAHFANLEQIALELATRDAESIDAHPKVDNAVIQERQEYPHNPGQMLTWRILATFGALSQSAAERGHQRLLNSISAHLVEAGFTRMILARITRRDTSI